MIVNEVVTTRQVGRSDRCAPRQKTATSTCIDKELRLYFLEECPRRHRSVFESDPVDPVNRITAIEDEKDFRLSDPSSSDPRRKALVKFNRIIQSQPFRQRRALGFHGIDNRDLFDSCFGFVFRHVPRITGGVVALCGKNESPIDSFNGIPTVSIIFMSHTFVDRGCPPLRLHGRSRLRTA